MCGFWAFLFKRLIHFKWVFSAGQIFFFSTLFWKSKKPTKTIFYLWFNTFIVIYNNWPIHGSFLFFTIFIYMFLYRYRDRCTVDMWAGDVWKLVQNSNLFFSLKFWFIFFKFCPWNFLKIWTLKGVALLGFWTKNNIILSCPVIVPKGTSNNLHSHKIWKKVQNWPTLLWIWPSESDRPTGS